jgi:hypothetical protein
MEATCDENVGSLRLILFSVGRTGFPIDSAAICRLLDGWEELRLPRGGETVRAAGGNVVPPVDLGSRRPLRSGRLALPAGESGSHSGQPTSV